MFNKLNITESVNNTYRPEKQTRIDVAQSMQSRLNNNLQNKQSKQNFQQPGTMDLPQNIQGWGTSLN